MVIRVAFSTIYLLGPKNKSCGAVSMTPSMHTFAYLYDFWINFQEFQILPFVNEILLQTNQKRRQELLWQPHDHIIIFNQENGSRPFANLAGVLLPIIFLTKYLVIKVSFVSFVSFLILLSLLFVSFFSCSYLGVQVLDVGTATEVLFWLLALDAFFKLRESVEFRCQFSIFYGILSLYLVVLRSN